MSANSGRRNAFLDEMGLGPLWTRRDAQAIPDAPPVQEDAFAAPATGHAPAVENAGMQRQARPSMPSIPAMPAQEAGLPVHPSAPDSADVAQMDWAALKANVAGCVKCDLCRGRTRTVFGVGDEKARWLFIGEGPGRNEDLKGEPFVGQAGKLLDNMLVSMGLRRGDNAYIANIVKCRPTDDNGRDRPPTPDEVAACLPYLERQIALIQPTMLVALGKTAALALLGLDADTPVSRLRGKVHRYAGLPLVVTYHPAYLLRNMADKRKSWEDLSLAMATFASADLAE